MKKFIAIAVVSFTAFSLSVLPVHANSEYHTLDDVINEQEVQDSGVVEDNTQQVTQQPNSSNVTTDIDFSMGAVQNQDILDEARGGTDLDGTSSGASKVNAGIKKVASFVIQVMSYFITIMLTVRVVIDLCYITVPFSRSWLANGYAGQPNGQPGMGQPGMGGMGGMGMGGMGMGGMGMNRMGMGGMGMNRMGMGGMGMMGQQGMSQPGATPAMGRIQWVSKAALNAAENESFPGSDGRMMNPLKAYAKDMTAVLIATPILLVLAISGALVNLGFMLGDLLANAVSSIGGMF